MKKRILSIMLALTMLVALGVTGCKEETASEGSKEAATKAESAEKTEKAEAKEEVIEIDFWNISTAGDDKVNNTVLDAIKTIESENPNIKINFSTTDGDAYKTKIKTALAANETPDIFYTWLPGYSQGFVDSGSVLKLDDYLSEDAYANINMSALQSGNGSYDGIYALPTEVKMGVLYCNKAMFDEHGIKIPDTYEELLTAVDQFNEVGIQPILSPGKRIWPVMWLYDILAVKSIGAPASVEALKKAADFSQPEFLEAANMIKELADRNAFIEGAVGLDNPEANAEFLNGNSPMYFMGSWFAAAATDPNSAVAGNVVVKRFPSLGNEFDKHMLGGTGDGFMVSENSEHKEEAVWVIERFTKIMAESDVVLFPAWNVEKDYSQMDPLFSDLNDIFVEADGFVIWWDTYLNGDDAQTHKNLTLELFAGVKTPEEFVEGMMGISNKK